MEANFLMMLAGLKTYVLWPLLSILLFFALVEAALWLFGIDLNPRGYNFTVNRAPDYPDAFLKDHDLFWTLRPARTIASKFFLGKSYQINIQGFRGDDFQLEKKGLRVAVLGNSCSFGWRVDDDENFARRLEQKLRQIAGDENAEVYNFSVPGYSSYQGKLNYLVNVRRYDPDILLVTFAWNDQRIAAKDIADKDQQMPPRPVIAFYNQVARLRLYRLVKQFIFKTIPVPDYENSPGSVLRVGLDDYQRNIEGIIDSAHHDGARVILLTSPVPAEDVYFNLRHKSIMHELHRYYNDRMRETAALKDVGLVDLAAVFDRYDNLFDDVKTDPFHYNARGHAIAADEIFKFLQSSGYATAAE